MPRLYVLSGALLGRVFEFDGEAVLGRIPAADVTLDDGSVSRRHARIRPEDGGWRIEDLGSSNGTFVAGERVDSAPLGEGEMFRVGAVELRLRGDSEQDAGGAGARSESDTAADTEALIAEPTGGGHSSGPDAGAAAGGGESDGGLELEFGEDLDEALQEAPRAAAAPPRKDTRSTNAGPKNTGPSRAAGPSRSAGPKVAGAAASRDARRRAALGGVAPRPTVSDGDGGRPVLQFAKTRSGGTDVGQFGWFGRLIVALLGLGIFGGALWAAFWLTQRGD